MVVNLFPGCPEPHPAFCLWHPGKCLSASPGSKGHVDSPQCPQTIRVTDVRPPWREDPPRTFARMSTTLTSGCFAGYLATSHSKWVTKDVRSTARDRHILADSGLPISPETQVPCPGQCPHLNQGIRETEGQTRGSLLSGRAEAGSATSQACR